MRGHYQFCFAPGRSQRRHRESPFRPVAAREHEFTASQCHPVQFRRIIQAKQAAIHAAARSELREHGRHMAARSLYTAGRVQFWEEAN